MNQDLRLSLQSFQDPIFHHPNATAARHQHQAANAAGHHGLFSGFDASAMVPWNMQELIGGSDNGIDGNARGGGGYVFNVPLPPKLKHQQAMVIHPELGHSQSQFFIQRGPLQFSNPPFVRASPTSRPLVLITRGKTMNCLNPELASSNQCSSSS